jgi:hypothetical protein
VPVIVTASPGFPFKGEKLVIVGDWANMQLVKRKSVIIGKAFFRAKLKTLVIKVYI